MEYLSAELLAKNIAKAVNRFREEQGDKPIESTKELLEALVVYGCSYRSRVCTILTENKIFSKRQNGIKVEYTFSDPKEPIHWSLFRNVRDSKQASKRSKHATPEEMKRAKEVYKRRHLDEEVQGYAISAEDVNKIKEMADILADYFADYSNIPVVSLMSAMENPKARVVMSEMFAIAENARTLTYTLLKFLNNIQ